jgi:hypothetical protein
MVSKSRPDLDDSYSEWRARATQHVELEEAPVPVRRSYRPYAPRKPSRAALEEADQASYAIDEVGDNLSLDQRLERLSERVVRRMELDLQYFSVPQLLTGIQRILQVRVLLVTLQQKGGGSSVGSAVRHYSTAFQPEADDAGHGNAGRRPAPAPDDYSNILELIAADADDDDDASAGDAKPGRVASRGNGRATSRRKGSSS